MANKKRRLSNFDFSGDNHAVALVSKDQGGAANGYKTLVMKSADVSVELTMAEFLYRFFDMWSWDAATVSRILGYSDEINLWDDDYIAEQTTFLTKMAESKDTSNESMAQVASIVKGLAKGCNVKLKDFEEIIKLNKVEGKVPQNNETIHSNEEVTMTTETIEKAAHEAELEKQAKQFKEMEENLKAEILKYQQKEETEKHQKFVVKAKEFSDAGIVDEKVEPFAVALRKASEDDDLKILVQTLEHITQLSKSLEEKTVGHSVDIKEEDKSMTDHMQDILKAKAQSK